MNLLPTSEQTQIVDAVRGFLAEEAPVERLRPQHGQVGNNDARLWDEFAELGFLGLGLAEAVGGVGLGPCEEALAYREFGRHLVAPGVLGLTLGARIAARAKDASLAPSIIAGDARVALLNARGPVRLGPATTGEFHVIDASDADWAIAWSDEGAGLYRTAAFEDLAEVLCMDSHVILRRARLDGVEPVAWLSAQEDPVGDRATLLLAAYSVGLAEAARDMAVAYAGMREQFGRPIGSFQAVKHKCADMAILAEAAGCQMAFASVAFARGGPDRRFQATAAKIMATDAALKNSAQNIQVHGAFGFTAEADAHLYLKRAHLVDILGGDLRTRRAALLREPAPY